MHPPPRERLTPQGLMQMHLSMMSCRVLTAALQLDVFSLLAEGRDTVEQLAPAAGASPRGIRMLLDALCALGLLQKTTGSYVLPPDTRAYLCRSSPDFMGAILETDHLWNSWSHLTEAIRTGRPVEAVERQEHAEAFFPVLIRSLHVVNREPARRLAAALGAGTTHQAIRVLDIGCGSAVWSIAVAEAVTEARVTAQDFPAVLKQTEEFVRRHNLTSRFEYLPGDFREVDLGTERFDLAILGNIVHSEGEQGSRVLFRRLHTALIAGGRLAIIDMIPTEDRTGPPFAVLFALNMLLHTEQGDTFTLSEYRDWLTEAGFSSVTTAELGDGSGLLFPAIIAEK